MPELPEVEVIARGLNATVAGRTVAGIDVLWPSSLGQPEEQFRSLVQGACICGVRRRAKLLLLDLEPEAVVGVHLKMTGRLVHGPKQQPGPHDRVLLTLDDGTLLTFADTRRFGYMKAMRPEELASWRFYTTLGPEPLETTAEALAERVAGSKARIKALPLCWLM